MSRGTARLIQPTSASSQIIGTTASLYEKIMDKTAFIRKVNITLNQVIEEPFAQTDLFLGEEDVLKERKQMQAVNSIKKKFGKNAILRGTDFKSGATARERNYHIGGHKSGIKDGNNEEK
jgi:DNA polymerase V